MAAKNKRYKMCGFVNKTLDVRTTNGLNDILLEPLEFVRKYGQTVRAPIGAETNGFSVPRCLQNIIPATGGDWFSAVLHDSSYENSLEVYTGVWEKANYSKEECDDLILEAMISQSVGLVKRQTIYRALQLFGWKAFNENRGIE